MFKKVLMVCVGNICRSPMAEALARARLSAHSVHVESAGIAALVGRGADPIAVELMAARGLDLSGHRARQLSDEIVRGTEIILVMEEGHKKAIEQAFPVARGRVHRLGYLGKFDIPDPFRQPRARFEEALSLIERGLADFEQAFYAPRK